MSSINDESLLLEFVIESREHLASIEPDLLELEEDGKSVDPEIINRVFRAIHSIKGASGFFGLEALKALSHSMESVLMIMRDGKLEPTAAVMDPLLIGVDRLRLMLDDIGNSETVPFQDVVDQLENLINPRAMVPIEKVSKAGEENTTGKGSEAERSLLFADSVAINSAKQNGHKIYSIKVFTDNDLAFQNRSPLQFLDLLMSTGNVLDTALDISGISGLENSLDEALPFLFLYSSVLEADLLSIALNIPEPQISEFKVTGEEASSNKADSGSSGSATTTENANASPPETKAAVTVSPEKAEEKPVVTSKTSPSDSAFKAASKSSPGNDSSNDSIRVKVDLLNRLMDLAGEMVLARNQLARAIENKSNSDNNEGLNAIIQNINLVTSDLQEHIMQTRMQPIASVFGKFPRVIRDLSRSLGKEIALQMVGEEVELDKSILESLSDPLTHLIRNCCDHGMEKPEQREQAGKPRQGTVILKAYQESGHINIAVIDDGAGIDHERVARKALEKGIITEATLRQMSVQEQVNLIFAPGFSTAEQVTDVSGRGVGMDVVRTNIEQIGGSISIETEKGKGTTILLRLPLTLAIIPSLVVESAGQTFAVPQINLVELVCVKASQIATRIEKVGSASVLRLRGKLLPLIKLSTTLGLDEKVTVESHDETISPEVIVNRRENIEDQRLSEDHPNVLKERRSDSRSDYNILVLKSGNMQYGLIVECIRDIEEIVVKPLSQFIKNCKCFSGATIMGDGRVAMILDVSGLVATSGLSFSEINAEEERRLQESTFLNGNRAQQQNQSILLFNSADHEIFALQLSKILRLEQFKMSDVERIGNRKFLPHQGKSILLIFLDDYLPVTPVSHNTEEAFLILPLEGSGQAGIVATNIIDALDISVELEKSFIQHAGVQGSAVINNHVTLFLNFSGLLESAGMLTESNRSDQWQTDHLQHSY
jgi:two-component system chemotaxis sensor kinase CheA